MSLTDVKADNNVPLQTNRPRYNIVGVNPTMIVQKMAASTLDGKRATTVAKPNPALLDPVVTGGKALWSNLTHGGVFFLGGDQARPLIIESMYANGGVATVTVVSKDDPALETGPTALRAWPGTFPFRLGRGECLRVTGAAEVGFMVRLDGQKVL